ncbi:hypothetical protein M2277_006496 [Paenibacillus sp. LBL]|uniref:hypothetical protein n=1 Tax=unclassified Paenibacillus TaxID=185978 RepID=UPI0024744993|nr:hypothetical protein [Paenibacillus sp. LBL]MDH6675775.1 hypothetical protein [Paenibacillus sp. LBL]
MSKMKFSPHGVRERNGKFTYRYTDTVMKNGKKVRKQIETAPYETAQEAYLAALQIQPKWNED